MALPHMANRRDVARERDDRAELPALLDQLAYLVADSDDRDLSARLVADLEAATNSSLGPTGSDSTVLLARRFARAHRRIITGPSATTAADIRFWITAFDGGPSGRPEERPAARRATARPQAARNGRRDERAVAGSGPAQLYPACGA